MESKDIITTLPAEILVIIFSFGPKRAIRLTCTRWNDISRSLRRAHPLWSVSQLPRRVQYIGSPSLYDFDELIGSAGYREFQSPISKPIIMKKFSMCYSCRLGLACKDRMIAPLQYCRSNHIDTKYKSYGDGPFLISVKVLRSDLTGLVRPAKAEENECHLDRVVRDTVAAVARHLETAQDNDARYIWYHSRATYIIR